jgi:hypothetical protein
MGGRGVLPNNIETNKLDFILALLPLAHPEINSC